MQIEEEESNTRDRTNSCALTAELEATVLTGTQDAEVGAAAADDDQQMVAAALKIQVAPGVTPRC